MGAFPFQITMPGVAIPQTIFWYEKTIREDDPVYLWNAPDRQCAGRVTARERLPFQPKEDVWCAFDFADILDNAGTTIVQVLYVEQSENLVDQSSVTVVGTQVRFRVVVPVGQAEIDTGIEVSVLDSNGNRHVADGVMYVTHGDA